MGRKPSGKVPPKKRILRAAEQLFIKQGYRNTTMRQIASKSKMGVGNIYYYFKNKYEIFYTLISQPDPIERFAPLFEVFFDPQVFPEDVERIGEVIENLYQKNRSFFILLTIDALEFKGKHASIVVNFVPEENLHIFREMMGPHVKDKIRDDMDIYFISKLIVQVYMNFFITEDLYGGKQHLGYPRKETITKIARVLKEGFLKR